MVCGMADVFQCFLQNGRIEVGFLGRRADRPLRQHQHHRGRRLRAARGAPARQRRRRRDRHPRPAHAGDQPAQPRGPFPEQVDFVTSPGHRDRTGGTRRELGMPGAGPVKVVTDKAILEADAGDAASWCSPRSIPASPRTRCAPASAGRSESAPRSADVAPPTAARARTSSATCSIPSASTSRADPSPMTASPAAEPATHAHPTLPRALGLRDLVLFNIVAVLSLRWFATAAAAGPSSITLWVLAALFFFVPQGLAVSDLVGPLSRGGRHLRLDQARLRRGPRLPLRLVLLGQQHPVLPQPADVHRGGRHLRHRAGRDRAGGQLDLRPAATLVALWLAVLAQHRRPPDRALAAEPRARWAPTSPASCWWVSAPMRCFTRPAATPIDRCESLVPDLERPVGAQSLGLDRLRLRRAGALRGHGRRGQGSRGGPCRGRSCISAPLIAFLYIAGTASVLWLVPTGRGQHRLRLPPGAGGRGPGHRLGRRPGSPPLAAALYVLGNIGGVGAWLTGPARVAFVIGLDRYFPPAFGRVHPRWKTPYVAILTQAVLATVFLLLSVLGKGTTVEKAYLVILDTMLLVYFIPYIYLFVCFLVVRLRGAARRRRRSWRPSRPALVIGLCGLALTLFAMIVATIPPSDTAEPWLFRLKVIGGAGSLRRCSAGDLLAGTAVRRWRQPAVRRRRSSLRSATAGPRCVAVPRCCRPARAGAAADQGPPPLLLPRDVHPPGRPAGPAPSPGRRTGSELIYSMQGSLWRQRLGSDEARQLTDGPGLRLPARLVARRPPRRLRLLPRRRDRAPAARSRDRREPIRSLADGAVNLEPRWSPDGRRLAFVSTRVRGPLARLHRRRSTRTGAPSRSSGSPKTGTAACRATTTTRFDQYLSPTWSPDGTRADRRLQPGPHLGLGRLLADAGASRAREPREIRYEETTWKARPDWSRDGRRVVYSSYLGRQWHQLWLMTADGGEPAAAHLRRVRRHRAALVARRPADRLHLQRGRQHRRSGSSTCRAARASAVRAERRRLPGAGRAAPAHGDRRAPGGRCRPASRSPARTAGASRPTTPGATPTTASTGASGSFEYGYFHTRGLARLTRAGRAAYTVEVSRGPGVPGRAAHGRRPAPDATTTLRVALAPLGDLAGARLVQRRPPRAHELRRRLPQRPRARWRSRPGRGPRTWSRT